MPDREPGYPFQVPVMRRGPFFAAVQRLIGDGVDKAFWYLLRACGHPRVPPEFSDALVATLSAVLSPSTTLKNWLNTEVLRELQDLTLRVGRLEADNATLKLQEKQTMLNTTALIASVTKITDVQKSAATTLRAVATNLAALAQQLKDAIAAGDPVALAAAQAAIDESAATLNTDADDLAAAIATVPALA